jgi:hypothetical protein
LLLIFIIYAIYNLNYKLRQQVLKLLGVRKSSGGPRYQPSDPRLHRRRMYGSMSSIPSSVSSRPYRERHRRSTDDRKKSVKDIKVNFSDNYRKK